MPRTKTPPSAEKLALHCVDNHQATGTLSWPVPYNPDEAHASVRVCDETVCRAYANAFVVEITGNTGIYRSFAEARKAAS